jgi:hypothetical protein
MLGKYLLLQNVSILFNVTAMSFFHIVSSVVTVSSYFLLYFLRMI